MKLNILRALFFGKTPKGKGSSFDKTLTNNKLICDTPPVLFSHFCIKRRKE